MVAVLILLFYIHEVVEGDQIGFVVDVENAGLYVLDVAAVVVNVVGRSLAVLQDVVVVPVVNDEETPGLDNVSEVLETFLVVPHIPMEVWEVGEGVSHTDRGIKAPWRRDDIVLKCEDRNSIEMKFLSPAVSTSWPPQ